MISAPENNANKKAAVKTKTRGFSLKFSIVAVTLFASILPLALYGFKTYQDVAEKETTASKVRLIDSNKSSAKIVLGFLSDHDAAVRTMAVSPEFTDMDPVRATKYLVSINDQMKVFYSIFLIDKTGNMIARSTPDSMQYVGDRDYFKKPMDGEPSYVQAVISKTIGKAILSFGAPVHSASGEIVGVLAAPAVVENISNEVTGGKIGKTGYSYLVHSKDKTILAHPIISLVGKKLDQESLKKLDKSAIGEMLSGTGRSGQKVKFTSSPVGKELTLISEIDESEITEPIEAAQNDILVFVGGASLLSIILSFFLAGSISGKITKLVEVLTSMSRAASVKEISSQEAKLDKIGGGKELRLIAAAIKRLSASIKMAMR